MELAESMTEAQQQALLKLLGDTLAANKKRTKGTVARGSSRPAKETDTGRSRPSKGKTVEAVAPPSKRAKNAPTADAPTGAKTQPEAIHHQRKTRILPADLHLYRQDHSKRVMHGLWALC